MRDARVTGISGITGRIVRIRHALNADAVNIRDVLVRRKVPAADLSRAEAVVALEDERMIGFGILEEAGTRLETRCLTLVEEGRRRGIGLSILRHLLEHAPAVRHVLAPQEASRYLSSIGFHREGRAFACGESGGKAAVAACCAPARKGRTAYGR